jgi:hypothetical protein
MYLRFGKTHLPLGTQCRLTIPPAVSKIFRKLCYGTLVLLTVFFIICFSGTVGQCQPLDKAWDITLQMPGTCINTTAFFYCTCALSPILNLEAS